MRAANILSNTRMKKIKLDSVLGYSFQNEALLTQALSHRSVGSHNNERLEFLGDSLLNFIIAEALYAKFPDAKEGDLSRLRASLVKGVTLAELAREKNLGEHVVLGGGELKSGGHRRASILADTVEAIIGAVYMDSGSFDTCKNMVLTWFDARLDEVTTENVEKDPKTELQEYLQERKKGLPLYRVVDTQGEAHAKIFVVECVLRSLSITTKAKASSKRTAEKLAAKEMLQQLNVSS